MIEENSANRQLRRWLRIFQGEKTAMKLSEKQLTSDKQEILDDLFDFYKQLLGRLREEIIKNYKLKSIKEKFR